MLAERNGRIFKLFKTFLYFMRMFSSLQILKLKSCYQVLGSKQFYIKTKARDHGEGKKNKKTKQKNPFMFLMA